MKLPQIERKYCYLALKLRASWTLGTIAILYHYALYPACKASTQQIHELNNTLQACQE